ncbi:MAG TPA: protein kinase [Candidatus Dormibacteraeota bacterium]|nr:protein kinase [Candidatus Dormibacteraeota bacterium]
MISQPTKIGKYEVVSVIGRGGMGVVYKARDPQLDRLVAIKMIVGATPGLLKRFDVEARSTGSLQHQNIVTIYDFGDQDGSPYLVMEYLEGVSLDSILTSGANSLSLAGKLNICIDVCNGLNYAHERGIIHRDIKPANIMVLHDGSVKIVDFGIARIGDTGISRTEIVGTIHYMSPEQFQSQPLDRRTDIFSTGVVLYQLLTGAVPFQSAGEAAIMYQIIHDDPPPLSTYLQDYPEELDGIIAKALAKNRDMRYPTGREFAFDLIAVAEKQKQFEVSQWLRRAETAVQKTEWTKAEDCLRQVLSIDGRHTQAHQLLSQVQVRIRQQRQVEQVRQLRIQADQAFVERRYDDALGIVDQAIGLDKTNPGLTSLREAIREAKTRAVQFKSALRRAEEAHSTGDLDEANRAVQEALEIDPQETSAKALQVIILKQLQEQERHLRMRTLLDTARDQITERNLTAAFSTLKEAELLDPASVELFSLLRVVNTARDEQNRKLEIDRLTQKIQEALGQEDYAAAISIAQEGLERYPREHGLTKLKALAETEQRRVQLKAYARQQFLAANGLFEQGKTLEALSLIDKALQNVPSDVQLQTLRSLAKDRLASEKSEDRKRQMVKRAKDLAAAEQYDQAVQILEEARGEFPHSEEIEELLRRCREGQKQTEAVSRILAEAQQLLARSQLERAVQFLENKTLEVPDARLFELLESARKQWLQFQTGLRSAIQEGTRIFQERGGLQSADYLKQQPAEFQESVEFRTLIDAVAKRAACEILDRDLARTPEPDAQVRLAEAAFRQNPENEDIRKRLSAVRSRKEQISAIAENTRVLEARRQYSDAAAELQRLRQIYPGFPNLESGIRRLAALEEERRQEDARRQSEQFQLELHSAIEAGTRILQQHGAAEAARYLSAQPATYRDIPEYRAFAGMIAQRLACETLDQNLARIPEPDAQVRVAEAALRENPASEEIKKRLAELRRRAEQIKEIANKARGLEASRQFGEAAKELERLRQLYPMYPSLESEILRLDGLEEQRLADNARLQLEEFQLGLQRAISEGKRILRERGGSEATEYVAAQAAKYHESPDFRDFAAMVAGRTALESLERELLRKPDPEAQIRLAEAAVRQNPEREEIRQKLAAVRGRKELIASVAARSRALEGSQRYGEAALELGKLRQIYPQYPRLDSEIRRLDRLEEQAKQARSAEAEAVAGNEPAETFGATVIMGRSTVEEPPAAPVESGHTPKAVSAAQRNLGAIPQTEPEPVSIRARQLPKTWLLAAAAVAVVVIGFVVYRATVSPAGIMIKVDPSPADSTVAVDGVPCPVPCQRILTPGQHRFQAEHNGYATLTQNIQVKQGDSPDVAITLTRVEPPAGNGTSAVGTTVAANVGGGAQPSTPRDGSKVDKTRNQPPTTGKTIQPPIPASGKEIIPETKNATPNNPPAEPPKPPTPYPSGTFAPNRTAIEKGESAELSWNVQNASTIKLNGQTVNAAGSTKVSPTDSTTYHLVAIGPGGEHDFDAAIVVNIPAPKPNIPVASVSQQDQSDIRDLLQKYAASYERKDAKAIEAMWPRVPKEMLNTIKGAFKLNTRLTFSNLSFDTLDSERVRVSCSQSVQQQLEGKPNSYSKPLTLIVRKKDKGWLIDYIPLNN